MEVCYSSVHSHKPAAAQAVPPTSVLGELAVGGCFLISIGDGGRMQGAGTSQTQGCAQSHQHRNQFEKHNEGKVQPVADNTNNWRGPAIKLFSLVRFILTAQRDPVCVTAASARPYSCHIISLYRTSTKCWPRPAYLEKGGKRARPSPYKRLTALQSSSCSNCPSACVSVYIRSNRSSPATESPDIPSPIPDPAFQLAVEAKELVEGVCTLTTDKGTELTNPE